MITHRTRQWKMYFLWKSIYLLGIFGCCCFRCTLVSLGKANTRYCHLTRRTLIWRNWWWSVCAKSNVGRSCDTAEKKAISREKIDEKGRMPFASRFFLLVLLLRTSERWSWCYYLFLFCFVRFAHIYSYFFLLSIKWQLKLLNYTFIEIYEFVNQNLWLGARQDRWQLVMQRDIECKEKRENVKKTANATDDSSCFAFNRRLCGSRPQNIICHRCVVLKSEKLSVDRVQENWLLQNCYRCPYCASCSKQKFILNENNIYAATILRIIAQIW